MEAALVGVRFAQDARDNIVLDFGARAGARASRPQLVPEVFTWPLSQVCGLVFAQQTGETSLSKEDLIPAEGVVIDKLPNAFFKVQLEGTEHMVLAQISGKMRKHFIRILAGDRVSVELSPYDLTRGRITYRYK